MSARSVSVTLNFETEASILRVTDSVVIALMESGALPAELYHSLQSIDCSVFEGDVIVDNTAVTAIRMDDKVKGLEIP